MVRWTTILLLAAASAWLVMSPAAAYESFLEETFETGGNRSFFEGEIDNRLFAYVDGQYEIDTTRSQAYGQSVVIENLATYRVEVKARLETAAIADAGFGLSFNYRQGAADSEFMLFLVYDRGAFAVLRYNSGTTTVLIDPQPTELFEPGEEVLLTVDSRAGQLVFYLNGGEVGSLREDNLVSGGVGMFATAGAVVRYDDFIVAAQTSQQASVEYDFSVANPLFDGSWGGVSYGYSGNSYTIDTLGTEFVGLSPFPDEAFSFDFAVDVELAEGEPVNGYGIYIRDYSNDEGGFNQYRFLISGEWYAVERSTGQRPLALTEWAQHPAIRSSGTNRLRVIATGSRLRYFINGLEVWSGEDPQPGAGSFGLFAGGGLKVAYRNAVISTM